MSQTPFTLNKTILVMAVWAVLGVIWTCSQFFVSEALYQISLASPSDELDFFSDASDVVAWPAGLIYEQAEYGVMVNAIEDYRDQPDLTPEKRQAASNFLERYIESKDVDLAYNFIDEHKIEAEVSTFMEYTIYVGTCVVWGVIIACCGVVITLSVLNGRKSQGANKSSVT